MSPLTLLNVQAAGVILGPIVLAWWLRQRLSDSWRNWGWGAATFLASQLARLPFIFIIPTLLTPLINSNAPSAALFWINLAAFSLTASLFEESARWLILHRFARATRGLANAIMFGAGHGGVEAILLVGGSTVSAIVMLQVGDSLIAQAQSDLERSTLLIQLDALNSLQWWGSVLTIWERVVAVTFHIGAAVAVMKTVMTGERRWWVMALVGHAMFNATTIAALRLGGALWAEIVGVVFAMAAVYVIIRFHWLDQRGISMGSRKP